MRKSGGSARSSSAARQRRGVGGGGRCGMRPRLLTAHACSAGPGRPPRPSTPDLGCGTGLGMLCEPQNSHRPPPIRHRGAPSFLSVGRWAAADGSSAAPPRSVFFFVSNYLTRRPRAGYPARCPPPPGGRTAGRAARPGARPPTRAWARPGGPPRRPGLRAPPSGPSGTAWFQFSACVCVCVCVCVERVRCVCGGRRVPGSVALGLDRERA